MPLTVAFFNTYFCWQIVLTHGISIAYVKLPYIEHITRFFFLWQLSFLIIFHVRFILPCFVLTRYANV